MPDLILILNDTESKSPLPKLLLKKFKLDKNHARFFLLSFTFRLQLSVSSIFWQADMRFWETFQQTPGTSKLLGTEHTYSAVQGCVEDVKESLEKEATWQLVLFYNVIILDKEKNITITELREICIKSILFIKDRTWESHIRRKRILSG